MSSEYIELEDYDFSEDACCEICQKAINTLEGAYNVDSFWFCSIECENKLITKETIKFIYK